MIVKIDLEKAYDRVDWGFLQEVLRVIGVSETIRKVILSCISSTELSVVWNSKKLDGFNPERGLQQGDPLSPYLFVLCMETLSQSITKAIEVKKWKPCKLSRSSRPVSHLFFADDLLLFGEASCKQAEVMQSVLDEFFQASGQKVNLTKSLVWYSSNSARSTISNITTQFGIPPTRDLGKYLGFPLVQGRVKSSAFQYIVDRVNQKLGGWQLKLLSWSARLLLIQSVTATILAYAMGVCKLPKKTLRDLDGINMRFFWGDSTEQVSTHIVAWEQICQPKGTGGLGLWPLRATNLVLLAKLAWRVITKPEMLWSQVLQQKYHVDGRNLSQIIMFKIF